MMRVEEYSHLICPQNYLQRQSIATCRLKLQCDRARVALHGGSCINVERDTCTVSLWRYMHDKEQNLTIQKVQNSCFGPISWQTLVKTTMTNDGHTQLTLEYTKYINLWSANSSIWFQTTIIMEYFLTKGNLVTHLNSSGCEDALHNGPGIQMPILSKLPRTEKRKEKAKSNPRFHILVCSS